MNANFQGIVIEDVLAGEGLQATSTFMTNEGIEVKNVYTKKMLKTLSIYKM